MASPEFDSLVILLRDVLSDDTVNVRAVLRRLRNLLNDAPVEDISGGVDGSKDRGLASLAQFILQACLNRSECDSTIFTATKFFDYESTLMVHSAYPEGDLDPARNWDDGGVSSSSLRRKHPPEVRAHLLKWLADNQDFPYPNETFKEELCKITGLTLTQVNN
ncbi:hypothetical protein HDU67_006761, partial [Dinochytrium kinnereticum]